MLAADDLKPLPVALHHVLRVELLDKWTELVHVLDTFGQCTEGPVVLNLLVERHSWSNLFREHIFDEDFEVVSVNLIPKGLPPRIELTINKSNQIPHLFE